MRQLYIRELTKAIHLKEKSLVASSQRFYHLTKLMDAMHEVGGASLCAKRERHDVRVDSPWQTRVFPPSPLPPVAHRSSRRSTCTAWAPSSRLKPWRWSFRRWCQRSSPPSFPKCWQGWWSPCCSTTSEAAAAAPTCHRNHRRRFESSLTAGRSFFGGNLGAHLFIFHPVNHFSFHCLQTH